MSFMKVWGRPFKQNRVISPYRLKDSGPMAGGTGWEGWRYHDTGLMEEIMPFVLRGTTQWLRDLHGLTITMVTNDLLDGMILQVVDSGQQ